MRLAATLLSTGRARDALPLLDGVLADHPADPQAHHLRGRCLDAAGNAAGAYASYVSALTADPNHLPSLISLSALYKAKGLWTEALDAARKAQLARPNDKASASPSSFYCIVSYRFPNDFRAFCSALRQLAGLVSNQSTLRTALPCFPPHLS